MCVCGGRGGQVHDDILTCMYLHVYTCIPRAAVKLSVRGREVLFLMTAPVLVLVCTEIAKSIAWPHGDCLVVFSNSIQWLPAKLILLKENCEILFGSLAAQREVRGEMEDRGCCSSNIVWSSSTSISESENPVVCDFVNIMEFEMRYKSKGLNV